MPLSRTFRVLETLARKEGSSDAGAEERMFAKSSVRSCW